MKKLMKCGHTANAKLTTEDGQIPYCVICDCSVIIEMPSLDGRKAKCSDCAGTTESNYNLAFFAHTPDKEHDEFYCGCRGWE